MTPASTHATVPSTGRGRPSALAALVLCCATATAQDAPPPPPDESARWAADPYTRGEAEAIEAAGYVRIGHFPFGDRHDTRRIEAELGRLPFVWIETEHFRLGSTLPEQRLPTDKTARRALVAELSDLAERLPNLRPRRVRTIDPWLRAHLYAARLERLYAEVVARLGAADVDWPDADAPFFRGGAPADQPWFGRGPHLGVKSKFLVLLCRQSTTCSRYVATYTGAAPDMPSRWYFPERDALLFATALDFSDGSFATDVALHAHLVFNVTHNLLDAYKGYSYRAPAWSQEGLAHWLRRRVSTEHNNYSSFEGDTTRAYATFDWPLKVRQRLEHGLVTPLAERLDANSTDAFTLVDHWACWSRIDFAIEHFRPEAIATYFDRLHGFVDRQGNPPTAEALAARHREALQEAFGTDADGFDAAWTEWVRRHYRER